MPLHGYVCNKCHAAFELLIRNGATPCCPECGSEDLTRKLSKPCVSKASDDTCGCAAREAGMCSGEPHHGAGCGCGGCCGHHH